ncbi:hypothetical protein [Kineococcus sp. SYSU DK002]|uniref:hypothetical protein n=1 Tax=Kineococcus sp. SYSU DK002 TaxID=3383123 RepID=UPI003D7E7BEC
MRRTHALLGIAAVTLTLLAGCTRNANNQDDEPSAVPSVSDVPSTVTAPAQPTQGQPATETEPPAVITASPDAAQTTALITALNAISPGLAEDRDRAVLAATAVCRQVVQGDDEAALSSDAAQQFAADGGPQLSDEQSRAVVDAVQSTFCKQ